MNFINTHWHEIYIAVFALLAFVVGNVVWYQDRDKHNRGENTTFAVLLCMIWPLWLAIAIGAAMFWLIGAILTGPAKIAIALNNRKNRKAS